MDTYSNGISCNLLLCHNGGEIEYLKKNKKYDEKTCSNRVETCVFWPAHVWQQISKLSCQRLKLLSSKYPEKTANLLRCHHWSGLVSPQNDVWEMSAEIPYWWRVTTQIWVVTRHQYGISTVVSQTSFCGETVVGFWNVGCFLRLSSNQKSGQMLQATKTVAYFACEHLSNTLKPWKAWW